MFFHGMRFGHNILWTDISVGAAQLRKLCEVPSWGPWALVRSLTIKILPRYFYAAGSPYLHLSRTKSDQKIAALRSDFARLVSRFQPMHCLESFSLTVHPDPVWADKDLYPHARKDLKAIIDSLPPSLCHLEIDFAGFDDVAAVNDPADHVCLSLRKVIPRLHNLRLRLSRLCEAILPDNHDLVSDDSSGKACTNTFIIEAAGAAPFFDCLHCTWPISYRSDRGIGQQFAEMHLPLHLSPFLRLAIKHHALDNFQRCTMFDVYYPPEEAALDDLMKMDYETICERQFMPSEKIRKFPRYHPTGYRRQPVGLRCFGEDGAQVDMLGNLEDTLGYAEGLAWIETDSGSRFPYGYLDAEPRLQSMSKMPIKTLDLEHYKSQYRNIRNLWWLEKQEGHQILLAQETDGLEDAGHIRRNLTTREMRWGLGKNS